MHPPFILVMGMKYVWLRIEQGERHTLFFVPTKFKKITNMTTETKTIKVNAKDLAAVLEASAAVHHNFNALIVALETEYPEAMNNDNLKLAILDLQNIIAEQNADCNTLCAFALGEE